MQLIHGGDWAGFQTEYGCAPLDFSANVSPLGLPAGVREAAIRALDTADRYPDPLCRALREALSSVLGVPAEWILCGNGAADLIYRLTFALQAKKALITAPAFAEYGEALRAAGTEAVEYPLSSERNFVPDNGILDAVTEEIGLVFLCEPSNPAGVLMGEALLLQILERCRACGAILCVDECFYDFLEPANRHSMLPYLAGGNLVILRAFTKFYGVAGLRIGYCISSDLSLLARLRQAGSPWNVSSPAQAAGIAALRETAYQKELLELIVKERSYLFAELTALGLQVIPGKANFLLFRSSDLRLDEKLRGKGILLRNCSNYSNLEPGWFRTAIRTHSENEILLNALKEVLFNG